MTQELRKLAEAATQGEWSSEQTRVYLPRLSGGFDLRQSPNATENAAFIAAANPAEILALLDRLEKAEKERDALQAKLDELQRQEPVGRFVSDDDCGHIDLVPHQGQPMVDGQAVYAAPKALEPLTAKEDWDIRGILASKLRVFHRATEAEVDELISLFAYMKSRTPLTQPEVVEAFCKTHHNVQYVSVFDAGVRFAEKHHGITKGSP